MGAWRLTSSSSSQTRSRLEESYLLWYLTTVPHKVEQELGLRSGVNVKVTSGSVLGSNLRILLELEPQLKGHLVDSRMVGTLQKKVSRVTLNVMVTILMVLLRLEEEQRLHDDKEAISK